MRDDFKGDLAGIRATDEDRVGAVAPGRPGPAPEPPRVRAVREPAVRRQRNGALWAVCAGLLLALIGLGYWSHQQQALLRQQLIATQESFARISEDAAGQLQDISGKVIATESSLSEVEKKRVRQLNELEQKVGQLAAALQQQEQVQQSAGQNLQQLQRASELQSARLAELDRMNARVAELAEQQQQQQQSIVELERQAGRAEQQRATLDSGLAGVTEQLRQLEQLAAMKEQLAEQQTQLARQRGELQALLEASKAPGVEQQRLDALDDALRSIDSFRIQTNRTISTLQTQIGNLQQQMNQP